MLFGRRRNEAEYLVIKALGARADMTGAELSQEIGMGVGSLYPVLMRLEGEGRIVSCWETPSPRPKGPPRRRFYALPAIAPRA